MIDIYKKVYWLIHSNNLLTRYYTGSWGYSNDKNSVFYCFFLYGTYNSVDEGQRDFFYSGRNDVIFPTGETSEYKMVVADMKRGLTEKD